MLVWGPYWFPDCSWKEEWGSCFDALIICTINTKVSVSGSCNAKGFLPIQMWDSALREILLKVLGNVAMNESGLPKPTANDWWHGMATALLSVYAKQRDRANSTLNKAWTAAKEAISIDIPSIKLCPDMTVANTKTALSRLSKLKVLDEIKAQWQKLSKNVQCLEY
ncbi:hypothetical protein BT96DRAFT_949754 [Gymnopus androsaceus JB14]|uniref:Uncharacterized protein n=1 Tax=Gymnopus androsaceus JB14 TaxID=1447944 RepID=A0A6A4GIP9_9AGAR|nr:hypothetical protein BT96DRAFT_949754 [Gymnopus androsaceus JB14]